MAHWIRPIARKLGIRNNATRQRPARRLSLLSLEDRITPSGETINQMIGALGAGKSVSIHFSATIDSPLTKGIHTVFNQGSVSGTGFSTVKTDDPAFGGTTDPTSTPVDRAPMVSNVFVRSTTWTPAFLTNLQTNSLGDATFGFAVPGGAGQLAVLPYFGIDRISIRFTENVNVALDDLQLFGANTASYGLTGFTYDNTTFTATWSVTGGIDQDKLRIVLNASANGVTQFNATLPADRKQLDGNWIDGTATFNSGDGSPGDDFSFRFNVQPGDANRDGVVNVTDGAVLRKHIANASTDPLMDLNGSGGVIDMADFNLSRGRIGTVQPAGNPGGTAGSGWVAPTTPTMPNPPGGPPNAGISAPKTDELLVDVDGDGLAEPGDTLRYTITITNASGTGVTNVALADTIDPRMTLVAGSVHVSPIANADNYTWVVNTRLDSVAAGLPSLFSNDSISSGSDTIVLSGPTTITTTLGGSVTINPTTGHFVYTPEAGDTGNDTFTYTIANSNDAGLTSMATVTIGLGTQRVWYVQGGATGGDGRSHLPLGSPASASTAATGTDIIYVLSSGTAVDGPFTLENNQQLLGQGVALTVNTVTPFTAGTRPTLSNLNGNNITLASGNTIRGLTLSNALGISVTGSAVGTFTMDTVSKSGTGRALNIATGTLAVTFDSITSTSSTGGAVVSLLTAGGSLTVTDIAGTDTSITGASAGISIAGAPAGSTFNFGDTVIGSSGVGLSLSSNNAATTTTLLSLAITTTAGKGIESNAAGNISIGGSSNTVTAAGGAALDVANSTFTGGATFASASSSGSPGNGIQLVNNIGAVTINGGSITTAAGTDFRVESGAANITYAGMITNTAGLAVEVTSRNGGIVLFSGAISHNAANSTGISVHDNPGGGTTTFSNATKTINSGTAVGVSLVTNPTHTINFTGGGLDIDTTTGTGFDAAAGGIITVTGSGNSITSTGGTALNMNGITVGAADITFDSTSSGGGTNGVSLVSLTGSEIISLGTGTLAGASSTAFVLNGGTAAVTYTGTITVTNGQSGVVTTNGAGSLTLGTVNVSGAQNLDALVLNGNGVFDVTITSVNINTSSMRHGVRFSDLTAGSDILISGGTITSQGAGKKVVEFATGTNGFFNMSGVTFDGTNSDGIDILVGQLGTYTFGSYTANTTNGPAVDIQNTAAAVSFGSITSATTGTAVNVVSHTGNLTVLGGTLSRSAAGTATLMLISGGSATINYGGAITNTSNRALQVTGRTGGTVTFSGALNNSGVGTGLRIDLNTGGTTTFSGAVSVANTNAVSNIFHLTTNTNHTINFNSDVTISATAGPAFFVELGGTVNVAATGTTSITATTATAIRMSGVSTTTGVTFDTVNRSNSGNGVELTNVDGAGTVAVSGGNIQQTTSRGVDISGGTAPVSIAAPLSNVVGADSRTVEISGRPAGSTVTISGNIDENDDGINIFNNAGTITLSGATKTVDTTGAGIGVNLDNNDLATINFTGGGLVINTTSGAGFNAVNGATAITVQGAGNTITTTTGTAVNITDTAIGGSGVTFLSINKNGNNTAIILDDTGAGPFTVTGTGTTDGSGGTIENVTNADAITFNNTDGRVTFKNMIIEDIGSTAGGFNTISGHDAIHGQQVDGGLTLDNMIIRRISDNAVHGATLAGNATTSWNGLDIINGTLIEHTNRFDPNLPNVGDANNESMVRILGITGTVNVTDSTLRDGAEMLNLFPTSGTMTLTVTNNDFHRAYKEFTSGTTASVGGHGIDVTVQGSANAVVNIGHRTNNALDNDFLNCRLASIRVANDAGATGDIDVTIGQNEFRSTDHSSGIGGDFDFPMAGVLIMSRGTNTATFDVIVDSNYFDEACNASGGVGQLSFDMDGGQWQALIEENTFDTPGNAPWFVRADNAGNTGTMNSIVYFRNNTGIRGFFNSPDPSAAGGYFGPGLRCLVDVQNGANIDLTIDNDDFALHDSGFDPGQTVEVRILNVGGGGTVDVHFANNTSPDGYSLENLTSGTTNFNLFRNGSGAATAQGILQANNNRGGGGVATTNPPLVNTFGTINFSNTAPQLPPFPMLSAPGGVQSVNPLPPASRLTESQMAPIFAEAVRRWELRGLDATMIAALKRATFQIVDLQAGYLGQAQLYGSVISLNVTADGYGWYVDPTPGDDSEFANAKSSTRFYTDSTLEPAGRMDLLTTVMHELGHVLGLDSSFAPADRNDIMYAYLTTGERRLNIDPAADVVLQPVPFVGPLAIDPVMSSRSQTITPRSQTPFGNVDSRNSVSQESKQSFETSRSQTEFGNEGRTIAWWMTPIELNKAKRQGPFVNWSDGSN